MNQLEKLKKLRADIDTLDEKILALLSKRLAIGGECATLKLKSKMPIQDKSRETEVMKHILCTAKKLGMDSAYVKSLYIHILSESRKVQKSRG